MMRILSYAVRKLNTIPALDNWLALRFSYGMNGILVRNSDLSLMTAYLRYNVCLREKHSQLSACFYGRMLSLI